MSHVAQLLNTDAAVAVIQGAVADGQPAETRYVVVAEAVNRLPIPWLCLFRGAPLVNTRSTYRTGPATFDTLALKVPVLGVEAAVARLEQARQLFSELAGGDAIGDGYWRLAIDGLQKLPFPFLTLDPVDVLQMNDAVEGAATLTSCLTDDGPATQAALKALSNFEDGFSPYTVQQLYGAPEELDHEARLSNAAALDAAFLPREQWQTRAATSAEGLSPPAEPRGNDRPWWKLW
ncbi:MAG: hypothetical protein EOP35_24095 [Rubrivivax sp.]|nr:MAG: hypothetical protein EOP35_24095 [Rubrivivax sp.]